MILYRHVDLHLQCWLSAAPSRWNILYAVAEKPPGAAAQPLLPSPYCYHDTYLSRKHISKCSLFILQESFNWRPSCCATRFSQSLHQLPPG